MDDVGSINRPSASRLQAPSLNLDLGIVPPTIPDVRSTSKLPPRPIAYRKRCPKISHRPPRAASSDGFISVTARSSVSQPRTSAVLSMSIAMAQRCVAQRDIAASRNIRKH
ncbi:hypothetical protein P152DRAFT_331639 [Eremomyces bilateralis CBS 781.70]|uniref:Uncharacterized protein n=1 Tax=Eremomyces bilateralis CBS 781.70 TaxID=1392243 RepID=A0A6G1G4C0_9PEZI|nr:uncharacterized protein P152DRAFT_331639 [Eremomyces bilateralis CBS 781.70]KAF1812945.1 hypothetical protein P152DRAFT_331639 [Eremomyces bilateralis CBS 781.70]